MLHREVCTFSKEKNFFYLFTCSCYNVAASFKNWREAKVFFYVSCFLLYDPTGMEIILLLQSFNSLSPSIHPTVHPSFSLLPTSVVWCACMKTFLLCIIYYIFNISFSWFKSCKEKKNKCNELQLINACS